MGFEISFRVGGDKVLITSDALLLGFGMAAPLGSHPEGYIV